jgi:ubiquinone/menaquinone biosynthesis C-methylase UbiE
MTNIWKKKAAEYWACFGKRLVEHADINEGACVLDIGSGRGTSLIPAAMKVGKVGYVVGVDNWEPFVKGIALEIKQHRLHNAAIINMDAERLGFKENCFDF